MRSSLAFDRGLVSRLGETGQLSSGTRLPRQLVIGVILVTALVAFELFNFDTTRYALQNLMGEVRFAGLMWATILAVAFCAIDFAGLARLFTPERGVDAPKEIWYLTGAWLIGASMNAVMTWWAVSLTLMNHDLGNEVLTREQLLTYVPIFVAILVWLTRILFIGALTMAGERLLDAAPHVSARSHHTAQSEQREVDAERRRKTAPIKPVRERTVQSSAETLNLGQPQKAPREHSSRVRQRPPRPARRAYAAPGTRTINRT
jgi:hypothetical protein